MGDTKVLCTASVEDSVPGFLAGSGQGWLTAEYGMLPGSSPKRIPRESSTGKVNSRGREIQRLIGRSLRAAVDLNLLGERTIHVDCDVIQADGGTRTASVTGSYVALAETINAIMPDNKIDKSPLVQPIAAVSVGLIEGRPLLDLCYREDSQADTDMNVVMTSDGRLVEIQATAEGQPFSRSETAQMLELAWSGIEELLSLQSQALASTH
jgi:ribonuclease PH